MRPLGTPFSSSTTAGGMHRSIGIDLPRAHNLDDRQNYYM